MEPTELKEQLQYKRLIRPSTSPWGEPLLFVKNKYGSIKLYIDYRQQIPTTAH